MKKTVSLLLLFASVAFAQDNRYGSIGGSATGSIGQTAQDSSGWQDDGTRVLTVTSTDSVGIGLSNAYQGVLNVRSSTSQTAATTNGLVLEHNTSGTAATHFGMQLLARLENSSGTMTNAGGITWRWTSASGNSNLRLVTAVAGVNTAFARLSHTGTLKLGGSMNTDATGKLEVINDGDGAFGDSSAIVTLAGRMGLGTASPSEKLHVVGNVLKADRLELYANVWTPTGSNGAATGTVSYIPTYDFDTATAETLTIDFRVPSYFSSVDSMQLEVACATPAGDSISFKIQHRDIASTELYTGAFGDTQTFIKDLGSTASSRILISMTTALTGIAADDRVILKLYRDPSISNDVGVDGKFVGLYVYGKGLK